MPIYSKRESRSFEGTAFLFACYLLFATLASAILPTSTIYTSAVRIVTGVVCVS
jgi:hypothetical protein